MKEKAILFGRFKTLVGVVSEPDTLQSERPAVLFANAGLIHRIGPNRIYVKLARTLAEQGFLVLRFDLSGVGDSLPRPDHLPVEQFPIDDLQQAMDYLAGAYGCSQFVLAGHCAGAYHSIRTATRDGRVGGVVMINPDGGEAEWVEYDKRRKLASYYSTYYGRQAIFDPQRWKRFLTFQVDYRSVFTNLFRNVILSRVSGLVFRIKKRLAPQQQTPNDEQLFSVEAILRKISSLDTRVLLIYSENSTSLERVQTGMGKSLKQLQTDGKLCLAVIPGADHIFSPLRTQDILGQEISGWMQRFASAPDRRS